MAGLWDSIFNGGIFASSPGNWSLFEIPHAPTSGSFSLTGSAVRGGKGTVTVTPPAGMTVNGFVLTVVNSQGHNCADVFSPSQKFDTSGYENHPLNYALPTETTCSFFYNNLAGGTVTIKVTPSYTDSNDALFIDPLERTISIAVPTGEIVVGQFGTTDFRTYTDINGVIKVTGGVDPLTSLLNMTLFNAPLSISAIGTLDYVGGAAVPGFTWTATLDGSTTGGYGGQVGILQVADLSYCTATYNFPNNTIVNCFYAWTTYDSNSRSYTLQMPLLDNAISGGIWYGGTISNVTPGQMTTMGNDDSPSQFTTWGHLCYTLEGHFELTLMWQPTNGIWVPLGKLFWMCAGGANSNHPNGASSAKDYSLSYAANPQLESPSTLTTPCVVTTDFPVLWVGTTRNANNAFVKYGTRNP